MEKNMKDSHSLTFMYRYVHTYIRLYVCVRVCVFWRDPIKSLPFCFVEKETRSEICIKKFYTIRTLSSIFLLSYIAGLSHRGVECLPRIKWYYFCFNSNINYPLSFLELVLLKFYDFFTHNTSFTLFKLDYHTREVTTTVPV